MRTAVVVVIVSMLTLAEAWAVEGDSSQAAANERSAGQQVDVVVLGGVNLAIGGAMNATSEQFRQDLMDDYHSYAYPFASPDVAIGADVRVALPATSGMKFVVGGAYDAWLTTSDENQDAAFMSRAGLVLGPQFTLFRTGAVSVSALIGITGNLIWGYVDYDYGFGIYTTTVPVAFRAGVLGEVNASVRLSPLLSIVGGVNYSLNNLIGRTYTAPPPILYGIEERELNDAPKPDDPQDPGRYIQQLGLRIGLMFSI